MILTEYTGPLTPAQVAEGINTAFANARRLIADAEALMSIGSWPTAASLAVLALEEAGKIDVLRKVAMASKAAELKAAWKLYLNHRAKAGSPIGFNPNNLPLDEADNWVAAVQGHSQITKELNSLKQAGLYTNCVCSSDGTPSWQIPEQAVSRAHAEKIVNIATSAMLQRPDVTAREIELVIKHVAPFWNTDQMVPAWLRLVAALDAEGLLNEPLEAIEHRLLTTVFGRDWQLRVPPS